MMAKRIEELDESLRAEEVDDGLTWHDVHEWGVEGQGWADTLATYDRLPKRAQGLVREPVWDLSRHSAGLCTRFSTDSRNISVRWRLRLDQLAMGHMPATGVSGVDLYSRDETGAWCWLGVGRPEEFPDVRCQIASDLDGGNREYLLYFPLYNGVEQLEIGVPADAAFDRTKPRSDKPIVFYGSSITQGACASRPGMAYTAILGRWLNRPVINLGFSGNGKMDPEIAELLTELDAQVYFIDCLPNMTAELVTERAEPLVQAIRAVHSETPIVLAEDRTSPVARLNSAAVLQHQARRTALRQAFDRLQRSSIDGLHYVPGEGQLGADGEGTVDGSHPNDLGFWRMATVFHSVLKGLC